MPPLFLYLLKLSVGLALVFLLYYFCLRRLTFYQWNRWYLLGYSLLCFPLALADVSALLIHYNAAPENIAVPIPSIASLHVPFSLQRVSASGGYSMEQWLMVLFVAGTTLSAIRFLAQYVSYHRLRKSATLVSNGAVKIYQLDRKIIPFSFGGSIYINQHLHSETELTEIIRHEFAHVKGKHTADIVWAELLCIINWYNPFAWLLRYHIRQNLEFLADKNVLNSGFDKKAYQYLLLKVTGATELRIATKFNFESLKKRIIMMNASKTTRVHLLKFLFILPATALLLLAFRSQVQRTSTPADSAFSLELMDTVPKTIVGRPGSKVIAPVAGTQDFLTQNPGVRSIGWQGNTIIISLKNGQKETFSTTSAADQQKFAEQYGALPPTPVVPAERAREPKRGSAPVMVEAADILNESELALRDMKRYVDTQKRFNEDVKLYSDQYKLYNQERQLYNEKAKLYDSKRQQAYKDQHKAYNEAKRLHETTAQRHLQERQLQQQLALDKLQAAPELERSAQNLRLSNKELERMKADAVKQRMMHQEQLELLHESQARQERHLLQKELQATNRDRVFYSDETLLHQQERAALQQSKNDAKNSSSQSLSPLTQRSALTQQLSQLEQELKNLQKASMQIQKELTELKKNRSFK